MIQGRHHRPSRRGQKRGRSCGDLATSSPAPTAIEPGPALLTQPSLQGKPSSLTLPAVGTPTRRG